MLHARMELAAGLAAHQTVTDLGQPLGVVDRGQHAAQAHDGFRTEARRRHWPPQRPLLLASPLAAFLKPALAPSLKALLGGDRREQPLDVGEDPIDSLENRIECSQYGDHNHHYGQPSPFAFAGAARRAGSVPLWTGGSQPAGSSPTSGRRPSAARPTALLLGCCDGGQGE